MMHTRPRRLELALVVIALLLPGRPAAAGPAHKTWIEVIVRDATSVWVERTSGDRINLLPKDIASRQQELERIRAAAKDGEISAEDQRTLDVFSREMDALSVAVVGLLPALAEVKGATEGLLALEKEAADRLGEIVAKSKGRKQDQTEDAFDALARDVASTEATWKKRVAEIVSTLEKGAAWEPGLPLLSEVDVALDRRLGQTVNVLHDTFDRVFEANKAVAAAKDGAGSALCLLCLIGDLDQAEAYLRTWSPPKIVLAEDLGDVFGIPSESGWIDVAIHGSPSSFGMNTRDGRSVTASPEAVFALVKKQLKPEDLANWRRLNDDLNLGLRMVSCATGADWSGPAQQLANIAGVPVKAPTNVLWLVRKGGQTLPIIHLCRYCASFLGKSKPPYFYDHIAASTRRGTWRTFQPQNDEADKKVRDLLLAAAERMPWWEVRVTEVGTVKNPATAADALIRLGSKTKKDELIEAITGKKKGWTVVDKLTKDQAMSKTVDASRLGLKCVGTWMDEEKAYFKDLK